MNYTKLVFEELCKSESQRIKKNNNNNFVFNF